MCPCEANASIRAEMCVMCVIGPVCACVEMVGSWGQGQGHCEGVCVSAGRCYHTQLSPMMTQYYSCLQLCARDVFTTPGAERHV